MIGRFDLDAAERLRRIVGRTGVIGRTVKLPCADGSGRMVIYAASTGNLSEVLDGVRKSTRGASTFGTIDGAGGSVNLEEARLLSIAEGLERYSSCAYDERQFIWSTARELGPQAVDLTTFPSVSKLESQRAPEWVSPNVDAPMRWVQAICMFTGEKRWIPAVTAFLHLPFASVGERFTIPISTGCALHTRPESALRNALLEVIERDAVALTWLQKIRWPRLDTSLLSNRDNVDQLLNSPAGERLHLFNATTDIGIPTVYGVSEAPHHPTVRHVVVAVSSWDFDSAVEKLIREGISCRIAIEHRQMERSDPKEFFAVHDGALYMADPARSEAFRFLLDDEIRERGPAQPIDRFDGEIDSWESVRWLLRALRRKGMDAYVVDLTSREVRDAGMVCVKVVVPQLMPLSFVYNAQFRGTPRLYEAPASMGHPSYSEEELNVWPQPFA